MTTSSRHVFHSGSAASSCESPASSFSVFSLSESNQYSSDPGSVPARSQQGTRRPRQPWNHAYEKHIFSEHEILSSKAPERRRIYLASLESYINRLHEQLRKMGIWPVPFEKLDEYHGLNSKTARTMVIGLQHDATSANRVLAEVDRKFQNQVEAAQSTNESDAALRFDTGTGLVSNPMRSRSSHE